MMKIKVKQQKSYIYKWEVFDDERVHQQLLYQGGYEMEK